MIYAYRQGDALPEGCEGFYAVETAYNFAGDIHGDDTVLYSSRNRVDVRRKKFVAGHLVDMTEAESAIMDGVEAQAAAIERHNRIALMEVTPKAFWQAAYLLGITEAQVDAMLDAIPDETERTLAKIEKEKASMFQRNHPLIESMAQEFGITESQLDDLFEANQIGRRNDH